MIAKAKVRSAWALLACVTTKLVPSVFVATYMPPAPIYAAALAVVGIQAMTESGVTRSSLTVVDATLAVRVNVPTAFRCPSSSWLTTAATFRSHESSAGPPPGGGGRPGYRVAIYRANDRRATSIASASVFGPRALASRAACSPRAFISASCAGVCPQTPG